MSEVAEVGFVDDARKGLVDHLMKRYRELGSEETSCRVVVLEGESGAGKSRIVREFYQRLREEYPGWLLAGVAPEDRIGRVRGPEVSRPWNYRTSIEAPGHDVAVVLVVDRDVRDDLRGRSRPGHRSTTHTGAGSYAPFYARKNQEGVANSRTVSDKWAEDRVPAVG